MENKLVIKPGEYGGFKISFDGKSIGALPNLTQAKDRCKILADGYKVIEYYILDKNDEILSIEKI